MPNMLDEILEKQGLKYEDLNPVEKETYNAKVFDLKTLNVGDVLSHIQDMKNSIALQLTEIELSDEKDLMLKARLKNYLLLEAFLTAPERAEKAIRDSLKNLKKGQ